MTTAVERRAEILAMLNRQGRATVEQLVAQFHVSAVTIRSDLTFLAKQGHIVRSHGAAVLNSSMIAELSIPEKRHQNADLKSLIGKAAAAFIQDGDVVILDSGTTTKEIAANMRAMKNVVVMTSGLDVAMELVAAPDVEVRMPGGVLRKNALSFSGSWAENSLKHYRANRFFLGVDGYDLQTGITTHNEHEAILNRLMCDISEQVIAVTDSSKFGHRSCYVIREFGDIDVLITDSGIPDEYLNAFVQAGVKVIIADKG